MSVMCWRSLALGRLGQMTRGRVANGITMGWPDFEVNLSNIEANVFIKEEERFGES